MGIYMIHIWDLSPILDIYNKSLLGIFPSWIWYDTYLGFIFNFIPILGIYNNINGNHYLGFSHHGFGMIHIWDLSLILFPFLVFTITLTIIITWDFPITDLV